MHYARRTRLPGSGTEMPSGSNWWRDLRSCRSFDQRICKPASRSADKKRFGVRVRRRITYPRPAEAAFGEFVDCEGWTMIGPMDQGAHLLPERVRAQLLATGIPAAKHHLDGLASLFPAEFNIAATGMSAEDMARVLVYLVERKIVSLPGTTSLTSVRNVEPGWHFCQFYRSFDQLLQMI